MVFAVVLFPGVNLYPIILFSLLSFSAFVVVARVPVVGMGMVVPSLCDVTVLASVPLLVSRASVSVLVALCLLCFAWVTASAGLGVSLFLLFLLFCFVVSRHIY